MQPFFCDVQTLRFLKARRLSFGYPRLPEQRDCFSSSDIWHLAKENLGTRVWKWGVVRRSQDYLFSVEHVFRALDAAMAFPDAEVVAVDSSPTLKG